MLIIISIFFYLKQILLLLEVLLVNKPSAKNMFVLLTSPVPSVFLISCPFAICIGISLGAIIIKDIKAQIIEKTRGSFIQIMLIGLIVSLTCIYISGYILPDSNISFNNAYRSALLNDDDIVFEGINNTPREMTMTQLMQEINLLQMKGQEDNRLLNIYKYEFQKNIAFSLSSLFFFFFSFSLVFNIRKHMYIALVISIIVYPIYYFLLEYIQLNFIKTGYAHYIVWIPNMILIFVSFSVNFINYFKKNQHSIKHL
jgi:lipopolysaccharide export LptBFGC system permease protein LptF